MTRANMAAGPDRTYAMNQVFAQMRALAIAAKPFVEEFSRNEASAGQRLAAISILQLTPDRKYIDWLAARTLHEQPFVFFQAGVAMLGAVRAFRGQANEELRVAIQRALATVKSHRQGPPDANTVNVLSAALKELGPAPNLVPI